MNEPRVNPCNYCLSIMMFRFGACASVAEDAKNLKRVKINDGKLKYFHERVCCLKMIFYLISGC